MPLFWTIAGLLTAVAIAFVLVPLFRGRDASPAIDRDTLNVEVIRQQLKELKDDLEAGELEPAEYEKAHADLEKELLYDLEGGERDHPADTSGRGRWITPVILVTVPAFAFLLYWQLGAYSLIPQLQAGQDTVATGEHPSDQALPSIEEMAQRLAQRLQEDPTNSTGWQMLGKTYSVMKRYPDAAAALERANQLTGGKDPAIVADYAEALSLTQGGSLAGRPATLLQQALALDPKNIKALWLSGYLAYQEHDVPRAIETWRRLAALFPPGSTELARINQAIQQVQGTTQTATADTGQQAGTPQDAANTPSEATNPAAKSLRLHVALADTMRDKAAPDDTVFIFARAMNGPRMPLAIVRKRVRDLPLDVVLDDSMAMSPAMSLSKFAQVSVEARISKSGNAMTQSGDLRGATGSAAPGQPEPIQITIDTVVP